MKLAVVTRKVNCGAVGFLAPAGASNRYGGSTAGFRFKNLKGDLALRPVYHQKMERVQAHILVAFISYTLHVCLRPRLKAVASGLTPRAVLEKFCAVQMVDAHLPMTDGRTVILTRHTQPEKERQILLDQLKLTLPGQPPPKITADKVARATV